MKGSILNESSRAPRIFFMGDKHGAYRAYKQCMERCGFDYKVDTLIDAGDVVDRWPESYDIVDDMLRIINLFPLRGNHDEWFLRYMETTQHPERWEQGGEATKQSYINAYYKNNPDAFYPMYEKEGKNADEFGRVLNPSMIPDTHQDFFKHQLNYYIDDKNRLFIHGGYNWRMPVKLTRQEVFYWDRSMWRCAVSYGKEKQLKTYDGFTKIFIGHTRLKESIPCHSGGVWNLDTGAGNPAGKLTIIDVDTEEYWQSDFLHELYPNDLNYGKGVYYK